MGMDIHPGQLASQPVPLVTMRFALLAALHSHARATQRLQYRMRVAAPERAGGTSLVGVERRCMANSIDESTFNQIASKPEAQSKILRLLDELAVYYQTLWGLGGHP